MSFASLRYLLGNITYAGAQFVIVVLLNKFGSPEIVGQYALGLAVTAPIFMLSYLHLRSVLIVDSSGKYSFGDFIGLRIVTTAVAFTITAGFITLSGFNWNTVLVIFFISLYRIVESLSDILLGIIQKQEKLDQISISRMAKGLFSILTFILVFIPTHSLLLALFIMNVGWLVITIGYDARKARALASLRPVFNRSQLKQLLIVSSPLGIVLALMSLNTNIPQYAIAFFRGEYDVGVYASLSYMIVACNVVVTALGEAITPRLARWHTGGRHHEFIHLIGRMVLIGIGISAFACVIGWMFGRQLLTLLYSPELAREIVLFRWLLVSTILVFVSSFLWYAITATGKYTAQIPLFVCTAMTNALACFLLVPHYGVLGAAMGVILALFVQMIGSVIVLIRVIGKARKQVQREVVTQS
ncbi:oligosaccharide flippase family protein [Paenibacillus sp. D2_2]|uniref:oligosaccharide flippase family protein n=1 Tax=Paenibacillus sp. D2_2 TaxID=3073092 RepID=UPI0028167BE9|nr:oligosaccharide flippase family protein [Paenibacillus sp. D2_2]WMT42371.1 oligosaccharide flippase family protein [Paenibacillus sp. D2_2]